MSGTEIFDIKPYLPFADSVPTAKSGDYGIEEGQLLTVEFEPPVCEKLTGEQLLTLKEVLAYDPRPGYQNEDGREYGFKFGAFDVRFKVNGGVLTVTGLA